jgi:hypothetical protein
MFLAFLLSGLVALQTATNPSTKSLRSQSPFWVSAFTALGIAQRCSENHFCSSLQNKNQFCKPKSFRMKKNLFLLATISAAALTACNKDNDYQQPPTPQAKVVKASGDLTTALADFRQLLGDSLNTVPGKTTGRREVNWDGVAPAFNNNDAFPHNFFNNPDPSAPAGRKRGLLYINDGTTLRVDSSDFADIDPSYGAQFNAFSGKRTFSGANSHIAQITFQIAGQTTPAVVKGFGAVFSDVDNASSTTLEFFSGEKSLGVFPAPVAGANSFSFLGVYFPNEAVTRVKITAGTAKLAPGVKDVSDGGTKDLVVMDDFFYNEPVTQ